MRFIVAHVCQSFGEPRVFWQEKDSVYHESNWVTNMRAATRYESFFEVEIQCCANKDLECIILGAGDSPEICLTMDEAFDMMQS